MIQLPLEYKEMALIRKLLEDLSYKIFCDLIGDARMKKVKIKDIHVAKKLFNEERNPWCKEGLCHILLDKIQLIEDNIQKELKKEK